MKTKTYILTFFILLSGVAFGQDTLKVGVKGLKIESNIILEEQLRLNREINKPKPLQEYYVSRVFVSYPFDLYVRDIYKNPLHPLYPEKEWQKKIKQVRKSNKLLWQYLEKDNYDSTVDTVAIRKLKIHFANVLGKNNFNLKDTLTVSEDELQYSKYSYSRNDYSVFFDSIAVNKNTQDTLNGFYKINSKSKDYDYYCGYFNDGTPFLPLENNVFLYYKNDTVVKKRFFVTTQDKFTNPYHSNSYAYSYAEDYIPVSENQWKREVREYPSENLLIEDTVIVSGKKNYIEGNQHIYKYGSYLWGQPPQRLLHRIHTYQKGKIVKLEKRRVSYPLIGTTTIDLTDKNLKTIYEERDFSGNLYKREVYINVRKKKDLPCGELLENYYINNNKDSYYTDSDKQCFVNHGEFYEYKGSDNRDNFLDSEQILKYEKGRLTYLQYEYINSFEEISDSLTLKTFGKPIDAGRKDITNYKEQTSTVEYYTKPDNKLFIRVRTVYEGCINHPLFDSYKCNTKRDNDNFMTTIEYFDQNGTLIFTGSFNQNFKGDYKDYLNSIFK